MSDKKCKKTTKKQRKKGKVQHNMTPFTRLSAWWPLYTPLYPGIILSSYPLENCYCEMVLRIWIPFLILAIIDKLETSSPVPVIVFSIFIFIQILRHSKTGKSLSWSALVHVVLIQARGLMAMDAGDSSDPYCKIALGKDVSRNGRNTHFTCQLPLRKC